MKNRPRGRSGRRAAALAARNSAAAPQEARGRADVAVAAGMALLYLLLAVVLLPVRELPRALGLGLLVFGIVAVAARAMGVGRLPGFSVMAVGFAAFAVLVMPTLPAMGGTHPAAPPVGLLGAHAAAMLWAALRWRPRPRAATLTLREACVFGLGGAALLSAVAAIPIVVGLLTAARETMPLLWVFPAYVAGFLAAATLFWMLQPVAHLATGRYLLSGLAAACVYAAMGPVIALLRGQPLDLSEIALVGLLLGGFVGPAVGFRLAEN